ncbi:MAG: type II toxin-antitoxin system RelE/ParE family toxin [Gammaproteobacteria bacterium]|jgi:toxin ParE1/3/4
MGNYRLSENAKADLTRIYRRGLREYGEAQADKYYQAFFERFEQLAEQPLLYQAVDDILPGYRRSVCGSDSIYYRIDGETVEIMAIIGQQDLDEWV